jgi:hypothetical protein
MPDPQKAQTPAPRASDEDRERVATILRDGYSHGRLDLDELQQRLDAAYAAKTLPELAHLTADLPSASAPAAVEPAGVRPDDTASRVRARRMRDRVLTYLVLMVFLVVVWALTGSGSFWPIWPIIVGAFILALDLLGVERRRGSASAGSRRSERRESRNRRRGR